MRPKSSLLLALIALSVSFMAFLLLESRTVGLTCEQSPNCIKQEKTGIPTGKTVLEPLENHLIVLKD
jgi:hypothetical protein